MTYTRKNQRDLSAAERERFVAAVLALKRSGRYDDYVRTHIRYYTSDGSKGLRAAHMTPSFLPWHRRFLLEFERDLRKIDARVTVPYWDWTKDRTAKAALWREDFLGGNGRASDEQVTTGAFAHARGDWTLTESTDDRPYLRRAFGRPQDPMDLPTARDLDEAVSDPTYDSPPWDSTASRGFRNKLEGWGSGRGNARWRNHNRVHRWVGGTMLSGASPNDPVFWLHHAFVDLVWSRWQQANPRSGYLPDRPLPLGNSQRGRVPTLGDPMPPWDVKPSELLDHSGIYRYA
ncbi:tyrosinase family protein [Streptomyces sp. NPDC088923]|uniref:tyrosinase family protein n=1 Tax=Streptomyces sp. NPDC088923 TaxID=3365913 RepID=UPI003800EE66